MSDESSKDNGASTNKLETPETCPPQTAFTGYQSGQNQTQQQPGYDYSNAHQTGQVSQQTQQHAVSNFHQNQPKYSEFLIVSAPVPAIIDEQRDLVEITRVENPAYKANYQQQHVQYQQQLQQQSAYMNYQTAYPGQMMPGYDPSQHYYPAYNAALPYTDNNAPPQNTQPQPPPPPSSTTQPQLYQNQQYIENNGGAANTSSSSTQNQQAPANPGNPPENNSQYYNFQ